MKTLIIAAVASTFTLGAQAASHAEKGAPMTKPAASAAMAKPAVAPAKAAASAARPAASAAAAKKTK